MNQWLSKNQDAIAVAIIVFIVLAGHVATSDGVPAIRVPELLEDARGFAGRVRDVFEHRRATPRRAIQPLAHESACLAPPGRV